MMGERSVVDGHNGSIFTTVSSEELNEGGSDNSPTTCDLITVLVTGAAGFIGSHVCEALLARGNRVIAVDELNDYYNVDLKKANLENLQRVYGHIIRDDMPLLAVYKGDICNVDFMSVVFEKEQPTHICHLAARAGVRPRYEVYICDFYII